MILGVTYITSAVTCNTFLECDVKHNVEIDGWIKYKNNYIVKDYMLGERGGGRKTRKMGRREGGIKGDTRGKKQER